MTNKKEILKIVLLVALFAISLYSVITQHLTRSMLDARAKIQVSGVLALARSGKFTPAELDQIKELWIEAEYHRVASVDVLERSTRPLTGTRVGEP